MQVRMTSLSEEGSLLLQRNVAHNLCMVSARYYLRPSINTEVLAQKGPAKRRALRKYEVFVRVRKLCGR
jgi:hypothetical protein